MTAARPVAACGISTGTAALKLDAGGGGAN